VDSQAHQGVQRRKAAKGRTFAARRDTAIISLYTGIPWEFLPRSRFWGRG
jgi:hypothetical protein